MFHHFWQSYIISSSISMFHYFWLCSTISGYIPPFLTHPISIQSLFFFSIYWDPVIIYLLKKKKGLSYNIVEAPSTYDVNW